MLASFVKLFDYFTTSNQAYDFPVDVVYTYAGLPNKQQLQEAAADCPNDNGGIQRWRDLGTCSVSIELTLQNLPWVRTIYVVVPEETVPNWLTNVSDPKVRIVYDRDICLPQNIDTLPFRNSLIKEANLMNIPDLAEHFIYIQDDEMFLNSIKKKDLFSSQGQPYPITTQREIDEIKKHSAEYWLNHHSKWKLLMSHMPSVYRKSWFDEIDKLWPGKSDFLQHLKCRGKYDDVSIVPMMNLYSVYIEQNVQPSNLTFAFGSDRSYGTKYGGDNHESGKESVVSIADFFDEIRTQRPDVITLNDDFEIFDEYLFQRQFNVVKRFLDEISPNLIFNASETAAYLVKTNNNLDKFAVIWIVTVVVVVSIFAAFFGLKYYQNRSVQSNQYSQTHLFDVSDADDSLMVAEQQQ